jgi:mono/diheme cytochrome c family protein
MGPGRGRGWGLAGVVLAVALGVAACGGGGGGASSSASQSAPLPTGAEATNPTLLAGRKIFSANCASCHGVRGQGSIGPAFTGGKLVRDFPNPQDQVAFVSQGRGVMPAFSGILTHAQIESVVAYERSVLDVLK